MFMSFEMTNLSDEEEEDYVAIEHAKEMSKEAFFVGYVIGKFGSRPRDFLKMTQEEKENQREWAFTNLETFRCDIFGIEEH